MAKITGIRAREVLDSRGRPTVEVDVLVNDEFLGRAIVPSGASTGSAEALELRDRDPGRYGGQGVRRAVGNVNTELARVAMGRDPFDQGALDQALLDADGTADKSRLGANALLGVSLAAARAAAGAARMPLYRYLGGPDACLMPVPMVNMINGGRHSENHLDMQDFLIIPVGARTYSEALEHAARVHGCLGRVLQRDNVFAAGVADEGGYGPPLRNHSQALDILTRAIREAGLAPGDDVLIAIDVAATHFYRDGRYHLDLEGSILDAAQMVQLLATWCHRYPVVSVEDGLAENDLGGWQTLTAALGHRIQLIGDDFFATNPQRLHNGIERGLANAVLVKANQIGTLTETLQVVQMAREAGYLAVVSARSGDTEDPFIADLAVATGVGQIKVGSVTRSERTAKYNQLLRIEEELGDRAVYPGEAVFQRFAK